MNKIDLDNIRRNKDFIERFGIDDEEVFSKELFIYELPKGHNLVCHGLCRVSRSRQAYI